MQDGSANEPVVNAPLVVVVLLAVLAAIHVVRLLIGPELDQAVVVQLAFFPIRFSAAGAELPGGYVVAATSLVTHALLHADWLHLVLNGAWLLAFGSLVARRTMAVGFLLLVALSAAIGALTYLAVNGIERAAVIGASGAVSGLMGASFRLIFTGFDLGGMAALQHYPHLVPRLPLMVALRDTRVLVAIGVWVGVNLLFGYFFPGLLSS
ncbi:MAG: rhomboid family intramembrane serine protease, partial [Hyphomicrobiaceae bacterium]